MPASQLQGLNQFSKIVNPDGTPTEFFIRLLLGKDNILGPLGVAKIIAGTGLSLNGGDGVLADGDITISAVASAILDEIGLAQGDLLYRGPTGWAVLAPGTMGKILETGGASANPVWSSLSAIMDLISSTRGSVLYRGASGWAALAPGTAGNFLSTGGAGADPSWVAGGGGGGGTPWWLQPPLAAGFSLTTTGTGNHTLTDDTDEGLLFTDPSNAADTRRASYHTLTTPIGDWDLKVKLSTVMINSNFGGVGLWAQLASSGREYWYGYNNNIPFGVMHLTNLSFNNTAYSTSLEPSNDYWLRMQKSGSNYNFYISGNGKTWQLLYTETIATWAGAVDRVGFYTRCSYTTTAPNGIGGSIGYWSLTGTAV